MMDLNLKNKVVLVTGSARGLGRAIAEGFLAEGASVVITDIDKERINHAVSLLGSGFGAERVLSFHGDFTKDDVIDECILKTIERFRRIDVLIANLGSGKGSLDWKISESDWNAMTDINFNGARKITNAVVPYMIENNYGSIVYISSIAGVEVIGAPIHYSVAKASLIALAKNLSKKLARNNIRANVVCPGNIYFEEGTWDFKLRENREKVLEMIEKTVPMNRFAAPEEVASIVLFLASEKASFITGSSIIADGGQTVGI
jgi:3-oxoacyl-[acyl-carrier protein] reductase